MIKKREADIFKEIQDWEARDIVPEILWVFGAWVDLPSWMGEITQLMGGFCCGCGFHAM